MALQATGSAGDLVAGDSASRDLRERTGKRPKKRQRVLDLVAARGWALIGEAEWNELRAALPDVSEATIRRSGISIAQPWRGVAQHTIEELEESLRELSAIYEQRHGSSPLLPRPGDRGERSCPVPGAEAPFESRDGRMDAGLAGRSRDVCGMGRTEESTRESLL